MAGIRDFLSLKGLALLFFGYTVFFYARKYYRLNRRKRAAGIGPQVKRGWIPFGLGFPIRAIRSGLNNTVMEMWTETFEEAGCRETGSWTLEASILGDQIIFTADPENIKAILATQFQDYGKGPQFHSEWKDFLGDSIFTTDGQLWHGSRALIRPMFMRERVADLDLVEEHVLKLLKLMGSGDGTQIRFDKLVSRFTLDAATQFLFGHSAGSLDDEEARFGVAFDEVQRVQALASRAGPLQSFLPKSTFYAGLKTMDEFIQPWIDETLALSPDELEAKLSKSETFIHALARHTRDRKVMRDQLVSLLLAGRDTTAATLAWLFTELARRPQVVQKLQDEITQVVGRDRHPTYDHIKDMKYLTYVINETLRLYPAVPFNVRASLKSTTLPRGGGPDGLGPIAVDEGTFIGYSTLLMQRRSDVYPPISKDFPYDPVDWVPERWATWTPKSWSFIPFNGGPRICIGQQFAMVEMGYTIIRILQTFDRVIDYGNDGRFKTDILLTPLNGTHIGFAKGKQ